MARKELRPGSYTKTSSYNRRFTSFTTYSQQLFYNYKRPLKTAASSKPFAGVRPSKNQPNLHPTPSPQKHSPNQRPMIQPSSRAATSHTQVSLLLTGALIASHGQLIAASSTAERQAAAAVLKSEADSVGDISRKEIQKRETNRTKALAEMERGEKLMGLAQYDGAVQCYVNALGLLPKGPMVEQDRKKALQGFSDASLRFAEVLVSEGRTQTRAGQPGASAEDILNNLLLLDPTNKAAKRFKEKLNTPGYYNAGMTPEFRGDVEKVKKYLLEGQSFFETGRFDMAIKRADQVLDTDPYNAAARKLQEMANNAIKASGESGYNEARSRALRDVQRAWANPVKRYGNPQAVTTERQMVDPSQVEKLKLKIQKIILPEIQFTEAPIFQVADMLTRAAQSADTSERNTGVLVIANFPTAAPTQTGAPPKTSILDLVSPKNAEKTGGGVQITTPKIPAGFSLREILDIITGLAELKWVIKENRVEIVPKSTPTDTLVLRNWTVSPFLFSSTPPHVEDLASTGLGGGLLGNASNAAAKQSGKRRIDPKEFLSGMNVRFDVPGSTATFNSRNRVLTVYNTLEMLDLVDSIVANSEGQAPVQVDIRAKFVEFTQSNLKELSFDWLLGQAKVRGSAELLASGAGTGGTEGFPIIGPDGKPIGNYPLTGGNRSGSGGIGVNPIDALLAAATGRGTGMGSAALAIAGAFSDPQFQVLVRAMNQRKDVDLLSSPSITARDQEEATIDIVREFRYPTEFSPPQIPQTIGNVTGSTGTGGGVTSIPVTPTTPSAFEKRDTGVKLRVLPTIKGDNYAIDLELRPEVTEFEGFINYGSPIKTTDRNSTTLAPGVVVSQPVSVVLTENVINQPIFSVRKIQTTVTLLDGETIALGGLMREDVQKVNDKTPILGDMPLIGRFFRSNVDQHIKKNLTIFVTARIIDASGQPIKASKSEIETEEVPSLANDRTFLGGR